MWQALLGLIPSLIGTAMSAGQGGSTTAKTPPERPKPEFQPMQRQPMASRQPVNFDPGATGGGIDPNDTRLQAIQSLRGKLGL
jgi:hypothetical protein